MQIPGARLMDLGAVSSLKPELIGGAAKLVIPEDSIYPLGLTEQ